MFNFKFDKKNSPYLALNVQALCKTTNMHVAIISTSAGVMLLMAKTHQNILQSQLSTTAIDNRMDPRPWQKDAVISSKGKKLFGSSLDKTACLCLLYKQ